MRVWQGIAKINIVIADDNPIIMKYRPVTRIPTRRKTLNRFTIASFHSEGNNSFTNFFVSRHVTIPVRKLKG